MADADLFDLLIKRNKESNRKSCVDRCVVDLPHEPFKDVLCFYSWVSDELFGEAIDGLEVGESSQHFVGYTYVHYKPCPIEKLNVASRSTNSRLSFAGDRSWNVKFSIEPGTDDIAGCKAEHEEVTATKAGIGSIESQVDNEKLNIRLSLEK